MTRTAIAAAVAVVLSVAAIGVTLGTAADESGYDRFVAHCDAALDESREGHQVLLDELAELPEGETRVAKADEVAEDAMRDVCGVKVHEAHTQPARSFADFVGS